VIWCLAGTVLLAAGLAFAIFCLAKAPLVGEEEEL